MISIPSIPDHIDRGIPKSCECVSSNGKVYILGGERDDKENAYKEVYVLDLEKHSQWK